ncbi:hypothetical protein Fcan01_28186 [Folsomia candida]|uniref:Uncharacterized protein n=1 Tax=Folsomia candida TaxID=158441 RepID=A0A226CY82_FOLCA|nr:hypothetical protein Fcan01_28186 [Folsomia candida]
MQFHSPRELMPSILLPGSTVSRAFNATPSLHTKIIYDTCKGRGFTWASSSFEQHTTVEPVIQTISILSVLVHIIHFKNALRHSMHLHIHPGLHRVTRSYCDNHSLHTKINLHTCRGRGFTWASSSFETTTRTRRANSCAKHDTSSLTLMPCIFTFTSGSTVFTSINANTTSSTPKYLRHLQRKRLHMASSSFSKQTHGRTVVTSIQCDNHSLHTKSFTTPAEEEASHGPVAVSKTTHDGHDGPKLMHQSMTISLTLMPMHLHIHPFHRVTSITMRTTTPSTPKSFTTPAEQGFTWASSSFRNNTRRDTTGKTQHQSMTISLTLMPMHLHIHPVPPCHEHSMRQPLPPHQNHLRHLQRESFTWASSSFETTHDGTRRAKTHAPKHDNFTHADAQHLHIHRFHRVTSIQCDNHSLHTKTFTTPAEEEASHGPVAFSKQHTTGEPGHPSTISIHEGF